MHLFKREKFIFNQMCFHNFNYDISKIYIEMKNLF